MMQTPTTFLALSALLSLANAHGYISTPSPRLPGDTMAATCGQQVYNNQAADRAGNVQGELQVAAGQSDYDADACNVWLCKGYKFEDNRDNVQSYTPGQVVDFVIDIIAPHTGVANVSIVDTATNTVIGDPLIQWDEGYASTATGVTEDETNFSVTIPEDLGGQCAEAGACVIQWYWFAESIDQTYESCVDFTVGGSGSGSGSGSDSGSSSSSSVPAPTSTPATSTTTDSSPSRVPTTMSTSVRPTSTATESATTTTSATPTATDVNVTVPKDGTADEQITFVASLLKALLARQ
ncbi:chitin binding domain-containing protein [Aspergillus egyptiacus]|nr:chitin binding domain-containing protein [Aspergillus egyptiacus]